MKIINCTPHNITVECAEFQQETGNWIKGTPEVFKTSGHVARIATKRVQQDLVYSTRSALLEFKISSIQKTEIIDLPEPEYNTSYIVSAMVLSEGIKHGRTDLIAPDTDNATRNDKGYIVSVPGFIKEIS